MSSCSYPSQLFASPQLLPLSGSGRMEPGEMVGRAAFFGIACSWDAAMQPSRAAANLLAGAPLAASRQPGPFALCRCAAASLQLTSGPVLSLICRFPQEWVGVPCEFAPASCFCIPPSTQLCKLPISSVRGTSGCVPDRVTAQQAVLRFNSVQPGRRRRLNVQAVVLPVLSSFTAALGAQSRPRPIALEARVSLPRTLSQTNTPPQQILSFRMHASTPVFQPDDVVSVEDPARGCGGPSAQEGRD